ncbi:MAG: glutamate--tRNA ligase [Burkholderiaceae bacterium]|nr:glutamate--tRNA ligase [Burkholderiaceae bacterium]
MFTKVRTRIAPSPTGMMHLGTARTAIYCWAVARHFGGEFLLRIEDTDRERSTPEAVQVILDAMKWLNLDYDNTEVVYQMDRLGRYREVVNELLAKGLAYKCYATKEELEQMREDQKARGEKPRYDGRWRPENCVGKAIPEGVTPVIRFRNPDDGIVTWNDGVYGPISIANSELDDLVIMRGDGIPTYNFAVVIDDWDMQISHVIRGADHINNTPRQINIYRAIGAEVPTFAHLPLIHGEDGQKLSKRHGTVSVLAYEELGFLPEAIFNYLARLGWAHGDAEKFSREELAEWFKLEDCSRSAAQFSMDKLKWLNHEYIKEADNHRLADLIRHRLEKRSANVTNNEHLVEIIGLLKDRASTLEDLADECMLFYRDPVITEEMIREQLESNEGKSLAAVKRFLEEARNLEWKRENILATIKAIMKELKCKMPHIAFPIRVLVTGEKHTPSIDITLEILGKDRVISQIEKGLKGW